ncbi:MAG: type II secretion system F family protein [Hyphomonadaceae bacterium]
MNLVRVLTDPVNIAGALASLACFATVMTIAAPMLAEDKLGARLKEVAKRREELRKKSRADLNNQTLVRPGANQFASGIVNKLQLQRRLADDKLNENLVRAGLRGQAAQTMFYFYRAALPIAFGLAAFLYVTLLGPGVHIPPNLNLVIVVGAVAAGFYAPNLYHSNRAAKRREAIMRSFPDSLDMMLICVESGMSIEVALSRVGQEIAAASVELAEEFALTTAELSYLPERRMAYENLARRTNHPGVKSVALALTQSEKYGTPIGAALRVMAKENRELRLSEAEKKAAALPAKLTVPMIVFFLPVLFAVIMGPAMIQISGLLRNGPGS